MLWRIKEPGHQQNRYGIDQISQYFPYPAKGRINIWQLKHFIQWTTSVFWWQYIDEKVCFVYKSSVYWYCTIVSLGEYELMPMLYRVTWGGKIINVLVYFIGAVAWLYCIVSNDFLPSTCSRVSIRAATFETSKVHSSYAVVFTYIDIFMIV